MDNLKDREEASGKKPLDPSMITVTGHPDVEQFLESVSPGGKKGVSPSLLSLQPPGLMQPNLMSPSPFGLNALAQQNLLAQEKTNAMLNDINAQLPIPPGGHHQLLGQQLFQPTPVQVARPSTPPGERYQYVSPKVFDTDYSPAKLPGAGAKGNQHWQDAFSGGLRQDAPDPALNPDLFRAAESGAAGAAAHAQRLSPSKLTSLDAPSKYIANPAFLGLGNFIDSTIKQFQQWQVGGLGRNSFFCLWWKHQEKEETDSYWCWPVGEGDDFTPTIWRKCGRMVGMGLREGLGVCGVDCS